MPLRQDHLSICNVNPVRLLCFALATSTCVLAAESRETFDQSTQLPQGWQSGITGQGSAKWEVIPEQSAPSKPNVLRQSGEATFAWAAKMDVAIKDGFVEVKIKPVAGHEDQAGGIIWRVKESNFPTNFSRCSSTVRSCSKSRTRRSRMPAVSAFGQRQTASLFLMTSFLERSSDC